jgi:FAD/FMN-containing dehydrogenase
LAIDDRGQTVVDVEAGCTIYQLLRYLRGHGGYTLPTFSVVGKQTIAGAIATATHGSGPASLSHYVNAVRAAAYDSTGKACIYEWQHGDELRAARCGLGCAGIVLSLRMQVERDAFIEEQTRWFACLEDVLDQEAHFPRQQFYLIPWSWKYFAQLRRSVGHANARPDLTAIFQRAFRRVAVDVLLNGCVRLLAQLPRARVALRGFYRRLFPLVARSGMNVVDRSHHLLMMRHDLYRHVEMELFVPARHVAHASALIEWVVRRYDGETVPLPERLNHDDFGPEATTALASLTGTYTLDHVITFRRVLRDDTLISMTSGDESDVWYAISLITYRRDIAAFLKMTRFLAVAMASAYGARPHWGKLFPLDAASLSVLYPALPRFRAHCVSIDPDGSFVNDFCSRLFVDNYEDRRTGSRS